MSVPPSNESNCWLSDSILDVWEQQKGDAIYRAAKEIRFRRLWMDKSQEQLDATSDMLVQSLKREGDLLQLVHDLRDTLDSLPGPGKIVEMSEMINQVLGRPRDSIQEDDA